MIALAGYAGIIIALASAVTLVTQGIRVFRRPELSYSLLRMPVLGIVIGAAVAMAALEFALITHDFTIEYVANNNSVATPLIFTIASGWAALEGSIVLWGLVLAGYAWWTMRGVGDDDKLGAGALVVIGLVAMFFFGLMATAANPFTTLSPAPADGFGANALLQNNLLMAVHPPLLYMGFVGFTVPFAFAISALAIGAQGSVWLERTRRATLVAWGFLTAGIVMGALWSYTVLGWGGYWAWDPVENASFIPWLVATAFIHSSVVQRRRGMLQAWNMTLVIATFSLTILGTFLTRSGVIASVHSFTQSSVGPLLMGFLVVMTFGSLALLAMRAHLVASSPRLESLASREGVFLFNNLLLSVFAFTVLIGTMWPIILEAFTGDQLSVGRPFFDTAAVPISYALLLAMGLGPLTPYRSARIDVVWSRIRNPLRTALFLAAIVVLWGVRRPAVLAVIMLSTFIVAGIARHLWFLANAAKARHGSTFRAAGHLISWDPGYWGGQISHVGVALLAVGITVSAGFGARQTISLAPGESASFEGYTVAYVGPFARADGHRDVFGATIELRRDGSTVAVMEPRLNQYPNQVQPVPAPAVRVAWNEDVYASLVRLDGGNITLDLYRYPLQWMLWVGGLMAAAGAALPLVLRKRGRDAPAETVMERVGA